MSVQGHVGESLAATGRRSDWARYRERVFEDRRTILEAVQVPMIVVRESDGVIVEANGAARRLTGYSREDLAGRPVSAVLRRAPRSADPTTPEGARPMPPESFLVVATAAGGRRYAYGSTCSLPGGPESASLITLRPAGAIRVEHVSPEVEDFPEIIGKTEGIRRVCRMIGKVAPTDSTILIQGESGTGKEVFARAVHRHSRRAGGPMIRVNCAALSETLLESELFGHVRGAFTGAIRDRRGRFREAEGGTILLDEVGSMSMTGQSKLLRVLQEREFEPVGSSRTETVDVRVIATTNVDLVKAVEDGSFRHDLYYRLSVIALHLPPLRERMEDIPLLANAFARRFSEALGRRVYGFAPEAVEILLNHKWSGNVRELENVIERAVVIEEGEMIGPRSLGLGDPPTGPDSSGSASETLGLRKKLEIIERQIVLQSLWKSNWVRKSAAEELGIDPRNLSYFLRKHDISEDDNERGPCPSTSCGGDDPGPGDD